MDSSFSRIVFLPYFAWVVSSRRRHLWYLPFILMAVSSILDIISVMSDTKFISDKIPASYHVMCAELLRPLVFQYRITFVLIITDRSAVKETKIRTKTPAKIDHSPLTIHLLRFRSFPVRGFMHFHGSSARVIHVFEGFIPFQGDRCGAGYGRNRRNGGG